MRMMRRAGLLATSKLPTLYELFSAATVLASAGGDSTGSNMVRTNITVSDDTSDPVWVISCTGCGIAFAKVKNRAVTYLKTAVTSSDPSSTEVTAYTSGTGTQIRSGYAYGVFILAMRFPDFSEAVVDKVLSTMSAEILAGHNSTNPDAFVSTPASGIVGTQQHLYLQMAVYGTADVSQCFSLVSGAALTAPMISRSGRVAGNRAYWRLYNNNYYLSEDGTRNMSVDGGTICHLS